jgi:hypothetical protein
MIKQIMQRLQCDETHANKVADFINGQLSWSNSTQAQINEAIDDAHYTYELLKKHNGDAAAALKELLGR